MKHKSIFTIFVALTMVLGFATTGLGQITNNIDGTATVVGALSISPVTDLAFGNLTVAGPKTIDLAGVASGAGSAGGIVSKGCFKVDKSTSGPTVSVSFTTLPSNLIGPSSATLPINGYNASWTTAAGSGAGGTFVSTAVGTYTATDGTSPSIWVHLGGTVTPGGTQALGFYEAIITLTAVYN